MSGSFLNVSSLRDFDRFMRASAVRSGQLLNKTELSKVPVGVSNKNRCRMAERPSGIRSDHFARALLHQTSESGSSRPPKLYFNDVGLLCFLLGLGKHSVTDSYLIGPIWETFLFSELRKYLSAIAPEASIWFYRDQSREIDFLIEKDARITLAEAKWKGASDAKGLPANAGRSTAPAGGSVASDGAVSNWSELPRRRGHAGRQRLKDARTPVDPGERHSRGDEQ